MRPAHSPASGPVASPLTSALASNFKARLMLDPERHRPCYEAHLRCLVMKRARLLLIRAGRELHVRPQGDAFELTGAVGLFNHDAGGVVAVFLHNDSRICTKMQIPELMARGERCK